LPLAPEAQLGKARRCPSLLNTEKYISSPKLMLNQYLADYPGRSGSSLSRLAEEINPVLKGWINYYGHFYKSELKEVLGYLNLVLKRWARQKYKKLQGHKVRAGAWLGRLAKASPNLFAHWQLGSRP
jgi:hypothetical protein